MPTWVLKKGSVIQNLASFQEFLSPQEVEIVKAIDVAAIKAQKELDDTGEECRTKHVLEALDGLGKNLGYETRSACTKPEWLFDAVWLVKRSKPWLPVEQFLQGTKWGALEGLKLACESEWHGDPNKVLEDFAKLTVVKAKFRLFIHSNQYFYDNYNAVEICKAVLDYSAGERYLFIGFEKNKPEFRVDFICA